MHKFLVPMLALLFLAPLATASATATADQTTKANLAAIQAALEAYHSVHGTYAIPGAGNNGNGAGFVTVEGSTYREAISRALYNEGFLSTLMVDDSTHKYGYMLYLCADGYKYALSATLQSPSAADISKIQSSCNGTGINGTYTRYGKNYALTGSTTFVTLWPTLFGRGGAYEIKTADEAVALAQAKLSMVLIGSGASSPGPIRDAMVANHLAYIDLYPQYELYTECPFSGPTKNGTCDPAAVQTALANIKAHLAATANDPNLIGYYVLDDYPGGDIRPILEQIHTLIAASNATSYIKRPAICGFGQLLDYKKSSTDTAFATWNPGLFAQKAVNFDPKACDAVLLYNYGENKTTVAADTTLIDWSMTNLLPTMENILVQHGWDQTKVPLIGQPDAFGGPIASSKNVYSYVIPTSANLSAQALAYCKAGAIAILANEWDARKDPSMDNLSMLYNTPSLVSGLEQGMQQCQTIWRAKTTPGS
jgi:type II secretory pathway pseudopilin PulG